MIKKINYICLSIYIFLSPISVITQVIPSEISILINILMGIYCFGNLFINRKIKINLLENKFIFLPLTFGILVCMGMFIVNSTDIYYHKFFTENALGRILNIIIYFLIYNACILMTRELNPKMNKRIIEKYLLGIFVFLILFSFWQILNYKLGIWIPKLQTRSHLHSVGSLKGFRVTGLANEPSYLAPFIIDFMILSLLYSNYLWILGIIVLYFSFSAGGYLNLIILILILGLLNFSKTFKKKKILLATIVSPLCLLLLIYNMNLIIEKLQPFLLRFKENQLLSVEGSIRAFMIFMPFFYLFEMNIFNIFLGMGAGSFKYLALTKQFIDGRFLHLTSNNLYTDFFYEGGVILFTSILLFFANNIKFKLKKYRKNQNRINLMKLLLIIHLGISSLYRADFLTARFWIILLILNLNLNREENRSFK